MAPDSRLDLVLAGDIGGTNTRLALFSPGKRRPVLRALEVVPSKDAPTLEAIIARFLSKRRALVSAACFGIAGPVQGGCAKATNLPWKVTEAALKRRFRWNQVTLLNDLTATAHAIPFLTRDEISILNAGKAGRRQTIGLVAPGTGLGQSLLVWTRSEFLPAPSEGGHADFAPTDDLQAELWRHLRRRFRHVSVERVISGPGLVNIYGWLRKRSGDREPAWLSRDLQERDPAGVIARSALTGRDPVCSESLQIFVSILGAVAGNLALTGFTTGGLYLGGGIPPKILPWLMEGPFMESFTAKGRFEDWMKDIPVYVILNEKTALLGAAVFALRQRSQAS